jgi:hypothetical protein
LTAYVCTSTGRDFLDQLNKKTLSLELCAPMALFFYREIFPTRGEELFHYSQGKNVFPALKKKKLPQVKFYLKMREYFSRLMKMKKSFPCVGEKKNSFPCLQDCKFYKDSCW